MQQISLIAAVDEHHGIGLNGNLLCHLPADLAYFKKNTINKPIIMGRTTYESIGKPLPHRRNIILSKQLHTITGAEVYASVEQALAVLDEVEEIMIIGGEQIYQQTLPLATSLYLTRIHHNFKADRFFPTIDWSQWQLVLEQSKGKDEKNQFDMTFCKYQRI